ncbi:hypothetical protein [Actinomadura xylanilytica]|nr:hypothetical protein [Actinomadura xylanilytica]MDL4774985.1 hypothetical protein [Actinomadura xylanilytica]
MGKHGKEVACSACKGSGEQKIGRNGKTDTVSCTVCNGTGKV